MVYNLITTGSSDTKNKKNLFYLGNWCHNFKEKKFDEIKNFRTHKYHWSNKKKFSKDCHKIEKLTEIIFLDLYKTLNKIHKINESDEYWRLIIYQWLINYITVFFDRWETSKSFLKKNNKKKFILNTFDYNKKIFHNNNHTVFFEKANSDEWNNYLYKRIFTYLDSSVIYKYIKLNKKKNPNTNLRRNNNYFSTFKKKFDKYLSKIAFSFNPIIFESFYFPLKFYLSLCVRNYLIPARYHQFFSMDVKNLYNSRLRLEAKKYLNQKIKFKNKSFKKLIYSNIFQDMPLSYLENFLIYKFYSKKLAKDKKCIISMFSIVWNDYFKIYLAEAKKKGSKIIISDHGGGLYPKYNSNYKFYKKVYHKKISYRKSYKDDFHVSLNPTLPYLSKDKITEKQKNLLFCLTDISRYQNKIVSIPFFDDWITQLEKLIKNIGFIKEEIKPFLKFRIKNIREDQNICESIIKNNFKFSKIENESTRPFYETISDSKIIIHNFAQTAFTESMHFNIPSILICSSSTMIFDKGSMKIFKILKKNDMAFENIRDCIDFLNRNWNNIENWWNSKKIQKARKAYLNSHFTSYGKPLKKWDIFLKKIKKDLNKPLLFNE